MPKRTYKSQGGSSSKKYKKRLTSISQIVDISKSNTSVRGVIQSLSDLKESDAGNEYFHFYLHDSNGKIYCFGFCEKQHKKLREGMSVELTNVRIQTSKYTGKTEIKLTDESTVRKTKTIDVTIPENWTKIEDIFAMDGDSLIDFKGQCSESPKKDKKKITFMATDTDSTKSSVVTVSGAVQLSKKSLLDRALGPSGIRPRGLSGSANERKKGKNRKSGKTVAARPPRLTPSPEETKTITPDGVT